VQTLGQIRELLESRGLSPRKSLGQNFLIDQNLIRKLVDEAEVGAGELVLEVGPGTGTLTEELLLRGCRVVACELDRGLAELLRERLGNPQESLGAPPQARFQLVEGDVLQSKRALSAEVVRALRAGGESHQAAPQAFKLVANLPYGAGTPVMLALLVDHPECRGMYVTIQREVADRLLARPRTKDYGPLAVVAQALAEVNRIAVLGPECFWPRPEVTSAMVSVLRKAGPLTGNPRRLADFTQQVFSRRRKQLGTVLGRGFPFPGGISPEDRVESLSVEQVVALAHQVG
jgi:16S rRNA (adenine1518-N6/adenine1519-N6)-dimethyltransferase